MSGSEATQTFAVMFEGYERALDRLNLAVKQKDAVDVFIPLFEALNWAVALDERTAQHWAPDGKVLGWNWRERVPAGETMAGVRYARNRAHHQWADALALEEGARQYPRSYPLAYFEWVWRAPSELPAGKRDDAGATLYRERLEGRAGRATLTELSEAFAFLRRVLEPSSLVVSLADLAAYE